MKYRLTQSQVEEIRSRRAAGEVGRVLADEFGISLKYVYALCTDKNRRWDDDGASRGDVDDVDGVGPLSTRDGMKAFCNAVLAYELTAANFSLGARRWSRGEIEALAQERGVAVSEFAGEPIPRETYAEFSRRMRKAHAARAAYNRAILVGR